MRVTLEYTAQLRRAAGVREESLELPDAATLDDALRAATVRHEGDFERQLFVDARTRQPTLLFFRGETQVPAGANPPLQEGERITVMSPISGG